MNEKEGLAWWRLGLYVCAIGLILCGLYVLLKGERAGAEGRLLTRTMQAAGEDQRSLHEVELESAGGGERLSGERGRDSPGGGGGGGGRHEGSPAE